MAEIYGSGDLYKYKTYAGSRWGEHNWLEIKEPVHCTQNGSGGHSWTEGYMVLPGSGATSVTCYANIYICTRVSESLDTYIKIVPDGTIMNGSSGFCYPRVVYASGYYPSMIVTCPYYFDLNAYADTSAISFRDGSGNVLESDMRNRNNGDYIGGRYVSIHYNGCGGKPSYGTKKNDTSPWARFYHWDIGIGGDVDSVGYDQRLTNGKVEDGSDWANSSGWFFVGNLETDFQWSEDKEDFNGYLYIAGTAYYSSTYTNGARAIPVKVQISGLKRLLNYYPWALWKNSGDYGKDFYSCNRSGGHLQSRENGNWEDRKNRYNSNA